MLGRDVFMESLLAHGVEYLFGNPGTTESPIIDGLADHPALSYVLALHEGVAVGAAGYYAQASGRTGVVNLHVAPGLGNAIGMMYGLLRGNAPTIITAGQQDTRLRLREPILGHDLVAMAAPVTKWSVEAAQADELGPIMRRAFKIAHDPPSGPVFVALPINVMEQQTEMGAGLPSPLYRAPRPDPEGVRAVAERLLAAKAPALVVGDDVARAGAHRAAMALAEAVGASVWVEFIHQHAAVPNQHPNMRGGLPVHAEGIVEHLGDADAVLLAGGPFFEEVWYTPCAPFPQGAAVLQVEESAERLSRNHRLDAGLIGGLAPTLAAIARRVRAGRTPAFEKAAARRNARLAALKAKERAERAARLETLRDVRPMAIPVFLAALQAALPKDAVMVEEAITASPDISRTLNFTRPGDYFCGRGGGIGQGVAGALGVKLASPDRPVVCVSGDGSAMYSIQALWTAAHHRLPIVFIILANREYRILKHNLDIYRHRFGVTTNRPYVHMDLEEPVLDFVSMAAGMGVAARRVTEPEELAAAVREALAAEVPYLIEAVVAGKR